VPNREGGTKPDFFTNYNGVVEVPTTAGVTLKNPAGGDAENIDRTQYING